MKITKELQKVLVPWFICSKKTKCEKVNLYLM